MLAIRFINFFALLFPLGSLAAYEPEKIKQSLQANQSLYQISGWHHDSSSNSWVANTSIKLLSINIGKDISIVKSPHINPKQKKLAKARCLDFGTVGIAPKSDADHHQISELVRIATQRHIPQFTDMYGVRFEVLPEMKGTYVSLICRLKPSAR